ncbi:glucose-6-phosphate dehydrogenase [Candidatus Kirkpatrickella diaphorinae]|uniref:Glucose-6-phosphate 1-dehydrogenase n=1 Tax=Candidatus Kirkpatrickella diaphorinae TaxID=2984322 RepID=A0ABY6GK68_9PROT|nr:glucose-6-phosphate dehydrogenase [Candidatus Kirkpatrickella diaphorinae]UYH51205.1 glucose-6-phosphate dehydrogenase [Candidatus Kirkpatrickella diaphorinae]
MTGQTKSSTSKADVPRRAPDCTLVIFGGGGDLTKRLLVPSLYDLAAMDVLSRKFRIIVVDRMEMTSEAWSAHLFDEISAFAKDKAGEFAHGRLDKSVWQKMMKNVEFLAGDITESEIYQRVATSLGHNSAIFYFAVAAQFFGTILKSLGKAKLFEEDGFFRRVIIEKPFGHNLASAKALNKVALANAREDQIYRIDHFFGKEAVQSMMAIRFANTLFEPLWRQEYIDHVQITAAETIGVEKRGKFYEGTGALRDMVPNHLFVLLSITGMAPPSSLAAEVVRSEKTRLLDAIRPIKVKDFVVAQYRAGKVEGEKRPAYRNEPDVDPKSDVETYAALKLHIDNWRWAGVPFYLRTGKRLAARKTEVAVIFKKTPYQLFKQGSADAMPNVIRFQLDPIRGLAMHFMVKEPGLEEVTTPVQNTFRYDDFFKSRANVGYEALLYDCMCGDQMLFQSAATIEAGWAALESVNPPKNRKLCFYAAGDQGPKEADQLLERDGRSWLPLID